MKPGFQYVIKIIFKCSLYLPEVGAQVREPSRWKGKSSTKLKGKDIWYHSPPTQLHFSSGLGMRAGCLPGFGKEHQRQLRTTWVSRQFTATLKAVFLLQIIKKNMNRIWLLHFRDTIAYNFFYQKDIWAFHFCKRPGKWMILHIYSWKFTDCKQGWVFRNPR